MEDLTRDSKFGESLGPIWRTRLPYKVNECTRCVHCVKFWPYKKSILLLQFYPLARATRSAARRSWSSRSNLSGEELEASFVIRTKGKISRKLLLLNTIDLSEASIVRWFWTVLLFDRTVNWFRDWFVAVGVCQLEICSLEVLFPQRTSCVIKVSFYRMNYYRSVTRNGALLCLSFSRKHSRKLELVYLNIIISVRTYGCLIWVNTERMCWNDRSVILNRAFVWSIDELIQYSYIHCLNCWFELKFPFDYWLELLFL